MIETGMKIRRFYAEKKVLDECGECGSAEFARALFPIHLFSFASTNCVSGKLFYVATLSLLYFDSLYSTNRLTRYMMIKNGYIVRRYYKAFSNKNSVVYVSTHVKSLILFKA